MVLFFRGFPKLKLCFSERGLKISLFDQFLASKDNFQLKYKRLNMHCVYNELCGAAIGGTPAWRIIYPGFQNPTITKNIDQNVQN